LALFGAVMGQGVVWYTGQFYAQSFIETVCKVEFIQSRDLMLWAILMATPGFVFFGWLSDKVGRKWIMLLGMLLAILTYRPIYKQFLVITSAHNRTEKIDLTQTKISEKTVVVDKKENTKIYVVQHFDTAYTDGAIFKYTKTDTLHLSATYDPAIKIDSLSALSSTLIVTKSAKPNVVIEKTMDKSSYWTLIWLVFVQILYVTMVYGPIAAFLVEMFPTKIRYTSMSLPYHIGNGVFGGLVPFLGTLIVEFTKNEAHPNGDPLAGLWYPIGVASICWVIGIFYLTNKIDKNVMD
jgi:MFS family permease